MHWQSLNEETDDMNDVLFRLYAVTDEHKHLALAHLFDKPCFLGLLAVKADSLSKFHSNTHIPVIIGPEMRCEVTGDPLYKQIPLSFFRDDPKRFATTLQTENEESCTTYNMLKVAQNIFRWNKEMAYAG